MAITHIPQTLVLLPIAFGSLLLALMYCQFRIRRSPIDSKDQETLDRRLREMRQEFFNTSTSKHIADELWLIFDREAEPLCLPSPYSSSKSLSRIKPVRLGDLSPC
jgi:hypothetical protein